MHQVALEAGVAAQHREGHRRMELREDELSSVPQLARCLMTVLQSLPQPVYPDALVTFTPYTAFPVSVIRYPTRKHPKTGALILAQG